MTVNLADQVFLVLGLSIFGGAFFLYRYFSSYGLYKDGFYIGVFEELLDC